MRMPWKKTMMMEQKVADAAAAGSAFLAGTAWVADVEPVVTMAAGVVAILAGAVAAWYHFEKAWEARWKRIAHNEEQAKLNDK